MHAGAIDESRSRLEPNDVDPCTDERKAVNGEILDDGRESIFPLNQGFTVWWSEESRSVGCGAMRPRMCADTTWPPRSSL